MTEISIKPIETVYNNYKFRSRLEARWAIFLTEIRLLWLYEHEGFGLGKDKQGAPLYYLPDFWLPEVNCWAEVKPMPPGETEELKIKRLVEGTRHPCLLLIGPPDFRAYQAWTWHRNRLEQRDFILVPKHIHYVDFADFTVSREAFGPDYARAVQSAKQARFRHDTPFALIENQPVDQFDTIFSQALDGLAEHQDDVAVSPFLQAMRRWLERFIPSKEIQG